ncbi:long-chain-fatty-acid--CoA ligase [Croceicoccus sp. YJ47]|uniref:long-chain-fatty-acid--CoA ligase n=1 Tax=Croceicoccus sp. YJ47 TaxID=2798724 RepID=UPI001923ACF2|nr:long-chain-fatty-acid--CoA ligase [Croceicoccus sp. YJ47]QQN73128.1 long-chain-fatty-acid--CoA ligase [Croceicoccus sp. YJ47]
MALRYASRADEAYDFPLTIGHLLDAALATSAEQEIVYRDRLTMTYRDLRGRIGRLARVLSDHGAGEGTTVAVMDWDSHRYLEAYFAVPMMGAVLMTVNVRLPTAQIQYTLNHAKTEVIVVHRDFLPLLDAVRDTLTGVKAIIVIDEDEDSAGAALPAYAVSEYEALLAQVEEPFAFCPIDENAIATTFYTTGTTGDPKGVEYSHRQIVLLTLASNAPFGTTRRPGFGINDVYMPLTPMFHVHAWCLPYVATMIGVKQVYPGKYEPDMICRLRREHGVTFSHCVPTILQMVLGAAAESEVDLAGWTMIIGGSALTEATWKDATARGMNVNVGYGMSETGPMLTQSRAAQYRDESEPLDPHVMTMAGVTVPLVSARVVDEDMNDVAHDGVARGELVVRAPWLTQGYVGNADASAQLWRGGWMHTQDIATIDAMGRVQIRDRLKDVIKSGGEWIPSLEIEDLIAGTRGVAEVAVIGVPDPHWGERPAAVIVASGDATPTLETVNEPLQQAIADGLLSRYAAIERMELRDALPRTSVGKIDKKRIRADIS